MRFDDLLRAPLRHWLKMTAVWLFVMAAVVGATGLMSQRYSSEAKLFVRLGRENTTLDPTSMVGHNNFVALPANREDEINSVVQVLQSRMLAEQVVDELGPGFLLDKKPAVPPSPEFAPPPLPPAQTASAARTAAVFVSSPAPAETHPAPPPTPPSSFLQRINPLEELPQREAAISKFKTRLKVGAVKKANFINISYEASSPEKAQQIVSTLLRFYQEQHTKLNRTPGSHEFLLKQTNELKQKLSDTEETLREFKTKSVVTSVDEQRRILEGRMGGLQDKLFDADADLTQATVEIAKLETAIANLPDNRVTAETDGHPNEATDLMRQQLFALELKEIELLSRFDDKFVLVQDIRRQIAEARAIMQRQDLGRTQVTTGVNTVQEQLKVTLVQRQTQAAALEAKVTELKSQIDETRTAFADLNRQSVEIARLERETTLQSTNYLKYVENLEQTRLDSELDEQRISNVVVAQTPSFEVKPVRPNKLLNFALGFVFACGAAIGLAVLLEFLDRSLRTTEQLEEELGLPALAAIPRFATVPTGRTVARPR